MFSYIKRSVKINTPVAAIANLEFVEPTLCMSFHFKILEGNLNLLILWCSDDPFTFFVRKIFWLAGTEKQVSFSKYLMIYYFKSLTFSKFLEMRNNEHHTICSRQ